MYSLGDSKITYLGKSVFSLAFGFSNIAFIIPSHFITLPYFTLWMLGFFNTIQVSNSLDPDQAQHFDWPNLGPTVCKSYQQTTKVNLRARLGVKELNTKLLVDTTFWLKPWLNITMFHTSPHIIQFTLFTLDTGSHCIDPHEIQHKAFH